MIVGAIPFDMDQPTQLVAPRWSERVTPFNTGLSPFVDEDFVHQVVDQGFTPNQMPFLEMIDRLFQRLKVRI